MQMRVQFCVGCQLSLFPSVLGRGKTKGEGGNGGLPGGGRREREVNLLGEQLAAVVLDAGPSPNVLVTAVVARYLQDAGRGSPHDHAEDEPADSEEGVVDADLLRSPSGRHGSNR